MRTVTKRRPTFHGDSRGNPNSATAVLSAVNRGGAIQLDTLKKLGVLLEQAGYSYHFAVEVEVAALLKTIDNERDAQETIRRLKEKLSDASDS